MGPVPGHPFAFETSALGGGGYGTQRGAPKAVEGGVAGSRDFDAVACARDNGSSGQRGLREALLAQVAEAP